MDITINGKNLAVKGIQITYDQVVALAATHWGTSALHSVTYSHRVPFDQLLGERDGMLLPGWSVKLSPGMVFCAAVMGSA